MTTSIMLKNKIVRKTFIAFFWILLWQLLFCFVNKNLLIPMPTPVMTVKAIIRLLGSLSFWLAVAFSLLRVVIGYISAVVTGIFMGYISFKVKTVSELFSPVLRLIKAVPVAAFIILVFLWVDTAHIPQLIAFLTVLPIIWESTENALSTVDKGLTEMAKVMGMKGKNILRYIVFPEIKPILTASLITGLGFAFKSGVAAEVICKSASSLGELLWVGKTTIAYDEVFAVTAVIILLSILLEWIIKKLLKGGVLP
ncbi:MAG: ABC transporter permease subunit [Ruminococcaceae bacterium]|nr:ABC transporter permease subunit [Oscillospiraceae bacterium]